MCEDEGLDPPVTINTFLQPRYGQPPAVGGDVVALQPSFGNGQPPQQQPTVAPNGGSLLRGGGPRQQQKRPSLSRGQWQHNSVASLNRGSIGKHTVAEAARASGSSLNLYRSPPTIESEEEEEEGEEDTEEKELPGYFRRRHRRRE
jgi:hypothetical protein